MENFEYHFETVFVLVNYMPIAHMREGAAGL